MGEVNFLSVVPRVRDLNRYCETATSVVRWSDAADLDGVLIFTGTGAVLDPWVAATAAVATTTRLAPLIAMNPIYQHPFTAARMVASIGLLYDRRVDLNLITGTAVSDLRSVGDLVDHDERYKRLGEYVEVMMGLLSSPRPLTYDGKFYQVSRLQLQPSLPARLLPRLFVAGQSPAARRLAERAGAISIQMLMPEDAAGPASEAGAMHFGVVSRPTAEAAIRAASELFPAVEDGAKLVAATMNNTDSTWKQRLFEAASAAGGVADPSYWLAPFRSAQADCPYLVDDYVGVVSRLERMVDAGICTFVIDAPASEAEYQHLAQVVRLARDRIRGRLRREGDEPDVRA